MPTSEKMVYAKRSVLALVTISLVPMNLSLRRVVMSKAGDTIENPVTKERIVVRVGTEDSGGELLAVDGYVQPGGAVAGEHVHPAIEETFTVVSGRVGFRIEQGQASFGVSRLFFLALCAQQHRY
jgi:hypothetical protein